MRNLFLIFLVNTVLISCKKDANIAENKNENFAHSTEIQNYTNKLSGNGTQTFQLEALPDQLDIGKTIFIANNKTIISFDAQSNTGKIKISGKTFLLNHLEFTENQYIISGPGIRIMALDGSFKDTPSDCYYGNFPQIIIVFNGKKTSYNNVKVQDCPNYN